MQNGNRGNTREREEGLAYEYALEEWTKEERNEHTDIPTHTRHQHIKRRYAQNLGVLCTHVFELYEYAGGYRGVEKEKEEV